MHWCFAVYRIARSSCVFLCLLGIAASKRFAQSYLGSLCFVGASEQLSAIVSLMVETLCLHAAGADSCSPCVVGFSVAATLLAVWEDFLHP